MQQWIDGWVSISREGQPKENRSSLAHTRTHTHKQIIKSTASYFGNVSRFLIFTAVRLCFSKSVDNHISICRFTPPRRIFLSGDFFNVSFPTFLFVVCFRGAWGGWGWKDIHYLYTE